jgi:hypothetical protein
VQGRRECIFINFINLYDTRLPMQKLKIRHFMDVMHCEKIICKNILKYLMDERDKL